MHKYKYYAVFTKTEDAVEVVFPDLKGCVTVGDDFEDAIEMAIDGLSAWLVNAEEQFVVPPSSYDALRKKYTAQNQTIFPIIADKALMESYEPKKRVNVVFPSETLSQLDELRAKRGERDRSKFISGIIKDYLNNANDQTFKT
jgi:predicted RNase H-like HicB family nuclease